MTVFNGEYQEVFTVDVPTNRAKAVFADLDNIGQCYDNIHRYEKLDADTLRIALKPQKALNVTFVGTHDVLTRWEGDEVLAWQSKKGVGNIYAEGRARFTPISDTQTRIDYLDRLSLDIDINRLVAKALTPIVRRGIEQGVRAYLQRMRARL
ncbi:MAG: SRPBCC family protein [Polyangiaceae bacterium]|nr:SRPBCC family protein [Polyangiaceae bacterium]